MANETRQFCTFFLNKLFFGVEVLSVQEVIRFQQMTGVPLTHDVIRGLINLRGQIVTAIDMRHLLEMPDRPDDEQPMNVVVQSDEGPISLLVDEIGDVIEVSDEQFEDPPETVTGSARKLIRGVYKLDEKLLLVLDTSEVVEQLCRASKA